MKTITTKIYSTPIQLKLPMDLERIIRITDPVYTFNEIMEHIDLHRYFAVKERKTGRRTYDREKLLKIVLFAFMEFGYCSVRQIEKLCVTDIRFLWILDGEKAPSFMDCFQPLMEGFRKRYGFYPQYPVADAGYGSFNNYLYLKMK